MTFKCTPLDEISAIHARLTKTFESGITLPIAYRRRQLLQLARMVQENQDALIAAGYADLGRSKLETSVSEFIPLITQTLHAVDSLEEWTKPEKPKTVAWRAGYDTTIYSAPKGVTLGITPWNFPFVISLEALSGAIAAGCTHVVKPSELSPACAMLMTELIAKYLDSNAYTVVNGAIEETSCLMGFQWGHIFFTGSGRVGRLIAAAAAKTVSPLTLELGGQSPVFVDATNTDIELAAKRILWGKSQNTGQICMSPNYVLVPRAQQDELIAAFQKFYSVFWPHPDGAVDSQSQLAKVINPMHHDRIMNLLSNTKGTIVVGGKSDGDQRIGPAVVKDVQIHDILMEAEIFGPVLPIVPVDDVDDAIRIIRGQPTPLVIYVFTDSETTKEKFVDHTASGTLVLNDTIQHLGVHEIPSGGIGESGYGSYHGKFSFDMFTHRRGYINVPPSFEPHLNFRYAPYTEEAYQAILPQVNVPIPVV